MSRERPLRIPSKDHALTAASLRSVKRGLIARLEAAHAIVVSQSKQAFIKFNHDMVNSNSSMTTPTTTTIRVSILAYNPQDRVFYTTPVYRRGDDMLSQDEAEALCIWPSRKWMKQYQRWNNFDDNDNDDAALLNKGHPYFATVTELNRFNDQGQVLASRLRDELVGYDDEMNVMVEPFLPLYSSMEVGDATMWWQVKDKNYGCVVPIQQLPVSDELKSRLMLWRKCKDENLLDKAHHQRCNAEGHDLEEHILWELNVRFNEEIAEGPLERERCVPDRTSSRDSVESVMRMYRAVRG